MQLSCAGKCYVITGSNTGLGYETAKSLLRMGATVVMACRSLPRAEEARDKLLQETGVDAAKVLNIHHS
jgi:protochlorophyllide reductase